jgi:aldehyde dehydrogenase (NAD+)
MVERFKNYIDGKWVESAGGQTFPSINPADKSEVIGDFPRSDHRDVDRAVEAARRRYPAWRGLPAPKRAEVLFRAAELLLREKEDLAVLMTKEMGKVLKESRGDVQEAIDMAYFIAGEGRRLLGETTPSELSDKLAMSVRVPVGVVAAITPWNFPLAIPVWKLIPALVAGNTVVLKPAEDTPCMATKLAGIMEMAGLPPGVLNLVHGMGEEAGAPLVRHPDVSLISFTGSSEVGREVAIAAAAEHKRVSLEMGGKNAIIVMDDADLDLAIEGAIWGAFGTSGQRCTTASRLVVQKRVLKEFTDRFVKRAEALRLGDGLRPETEMGPVINEAQLKQIHRYTKLGVKEGAKLLTGGEIHKKGECAKGFFYLPTVFADVSTKMRIAQEEIFGPTVAILPAADLDEAIDVVNSTRYGLSSAIYTKDIARACRAVRDIEAGITYVNASTIGAEVHLPFGGVRRSGNGHREGGSTAIENFTEWKTVYIDFSGKLQKAQIEE